MRREVTRAADFLPHLAAYAGSHAHNSADGIAAACLPYQLESNPRIAIAAVVPEKHGRAAIRDPQKIGVAVVVEVEEAGAESAGLKRHRAEVLFDSDIGEGFVAIVVKEVVRLVVNICHEEVRFAVPVEVSRIGAHSGLGLSGVPESDFRKK